MHGLICFAQLEEFKGLGRMGGMAKNHSSLMTDEVYEARIGGKLGLLSAVIP